MKKIKGSLSIICLVLGIFFALYVGGWILLIKPIHVLIVSFKTGELTLDLLLSCILKIALSTTIAGLIWCVGYIGYNYFIGNEDPDWEAIERERGRKEDDDETESVITEEKRS